MSTPSARVLSLTGARRLREARLGRLVHRLQRNLWIGVDTTPVIRHDGVIDNRSPDGTTRSLQSGVTSRTQAKATNRIASASQAKDPRHRPTFLEGRSRRL